MLLLSKYMSWLGLYLSHVIIFNSYLHMIGLSSMCYFITRAHLSFIIFASSLYLQNNLIIDVHIKRDPSTEIHGYHPLYSPIL